MVMHIEVCQESSFFSVEDSINVILVEPDDRDESFELPEFSSLARDTSQTTRDSSDNTRVNIQTSILDDHEEDDEEDDEGSVLFEELHETNPSRLQEDAEETTLLGRFSPDRFFDSLCANDTRKTSRPCPTSLTSNCMSVSCTPRVDEEETKVLLTTPTCERLQVETNIWNLLGCSSAPSGNELESIWYLRTMVVPRTDPNAPRKKPSRASLKQRLHRIQRLRQDRWAGATRHGVTLSRHLGSMLRTVSMDQLDSKDYSSWKDPSVLDLSSVTLTTWLNPPGAQRMPSVELIGSEDGYDSDPELTNRNGINFQQTMPPSMETTMAAIMHESDDPDYLIYLAVQQTLNSTWTLTWHPNPENVQEYQVPPTPSSINIWMERGTVIPHSGVVIEPQFMWRDAYQSHRKRLNASCQKPWSIRLLNTCRIAPVTLLDKTLYPLARAAQCLVVKTCHGQEFLLEAQSPSQMQSICERWKIAVARFASLAVTEDIDAIAQEFFHPTLSAQTLTIQDEMLLITESSSEGSSSRSTDSSSNTPVSSPTTKMSVPTNRRWVDI